MNIKGLLFDLDGVIADTQTWHFISWQQVAGEYGITLDDEVAERFKGISSMDCLEIILNRGYITMTDEEKEQTCAKKTAIFMDHLDGIETARNASMKAVGVGDPAMLCIADCVIPGFGGITIDDIIASLNG